MPAFHLGRVDQHKDSSKLEKEVIYCVVGKNEIVRLKNLITSVDPHAFVSVTVVHDVLGEGFTLDEDKKPLDN